VRIKILGPVVSVLISLLALAIVVIFTRLALSNPKQNPDPLQGNMLIEPVSLTATLYSITPTEPTYLSLSPTLEISSLKNSTITPTVTDNTTATETKTPTSTPSPTATVKVTVTPDIIQSGYDEICNVMVYEGIQQCTKGPYHVVRVDPKNPHVRFETILPMGYDRYGNYGECLDVQLPDSVQAGESTGPGCFIDHSYPAERVGQMASRYPGAVVAFNGDFFSPSYAFGAMGLTVKNGKRLDGNQNDREGREVRRSSLSISINGDVRIGPIPYDHLPNPEEPWNWTPDPEIFYNTIGGLPLLVKDGHPVDLHEQCMQEQGWCPDQYYPRARTAVGKTFNGQVLIVIVPEEWGLTIEGLSHLLVELGAEEAINLDGGGSSQLWYDGSYLHYSSRPVAEGVIVFSELIEKIGEEPSVNQ
jgi:exopolysaccharide biosynthesis protein